MHVLQSGEPPSPRRRHDSIDIVRGLAMVLMLLDHTRIFLHPTGFVTDPTELANPGAGLFLTRWITHFCAPTFVFLAGVSASLQLMRGRTQVSLARFLVMRGVLLVLLEVTVVRFGAFFDFDLRLLAALQVIWVLGISMIILASLVFLPVTAVAVGAGAMMVLHNLLDGRFPGLALRQRGLLPSLWHLVHAPGPLYPFGDEGPLIVVVYPLVPWIGVMAAGFALGSLWRLDVARRSRWLVGAALALAVNFGLLRTYNGYGDPRPWTHASDASHTLLSFLNVTKYPPSLCFLLLTLSFPLLALGVLERAQGASGFISRSLVAFGRVPLFYYLLQWPVAHLIALGLTYVTGRSVGYLVANPRDAAFYARGPGFGLTTVFASWLLGLCLLLPACHWFGRLKQERHSSWLSLF